MLFGIHGLSRGPVTEVTMVLNWFEAMKAQADSVR
jgi:hypothetical protein